MHPDMTPETLERAALSTLSTVEKVRAAQAQGVDDYSFQVEAHVDVWQYLLERSENNEPATTADVLVVTGVQLDSDLTDDGTLVSTLSMLALQRKARAVMRDRADELGEDPEAAVVGLLGDLGSLTTPAAVRGHVRRFAEDVADRYDRYTQRQERVNDGGSIGIPTGIPLFDNEGSHWMPGEVAALIGPSGVGKSYWLTKMAADAYFDHGARVLFLSPESMVEDIEYRLDPIIARKLGLSLSNKALRTGRQDAKTYGEYTAALREWETTHDQGWVTIDTGDSGLFRVEDVMSRAREHLAGTGPDRPGILCIDGFHLIRGEGKTWEFMAEAATAVMGLAHDMGITVLSVSQTKRSVLQNLGDAAGLADAAYGLALVENADRTISIAEKRGDPSQRVFKVPKNRHGEKETDRQYLHFDVDSGDIRQIGIHIDDATGIVDEVDF